MRRYDGGQGPRAAATCRGLSSVELAVIGAVVLVLGVMLVLRFQEAQKRRAFTADARPAVQALDAVAAAVEVGVLYADYGKRVADAKAVVDQFLRRWPTDLAPPLRASVEGAMSDFALGLEVWAQRIKGGTWVSTEHEMASKLLAVPGVQVRRVSFGGVGLPDKDVIDLEPVQQALWARALRQLKQARGMVSP